MVDKHFAQEQLFNADLELRCGFVWLFSVTIPDFQRASPIRLFEYGSDNLTFLSTNCVLGSVPSDSHGMPFLSLRTEKALET